MPDRRTIEEVLAGLAARRTPRYDSSAALLLTRAVGQAHLVAGPGPVDRTACEAFALTLRDAWATYEDRPRPEEVADAVVAAAVEAAGRDTLPLHDPHEAPPLALAAVGDALGAYHGALEVGATGAARELVQRRVAVALAYMVWMLRVLP
jgi:hypothetical protein